MPATGTSRMSRMLAPKSIAFIGGNVAAMAIRRTVDIGFQGDIWPVNPAHDEVEGFKCYSSVDELPKAPDAAFVAIRRELTIGTVRSLSKMDAGGCVCYAAGFSEIGGDGTAHQDALVTAADEMPLVGPNSFGLINYADRCALWPYVFGGQPTDRGVAIVSQSGNIAMNLTMNQRSVRITHVIGAGNQANLGSGDYVEALLDDDRVTVIGMYIEGIDDIDRFARAAERAMHKGVPIVVMKVGRTEASAKQSSSHTSSLTGSDVLHDAFFERLGVIRVNSLNRLLETLKVLDLAPPLTGVDIVTLSCSGGEAAIIADLTPTLGLSTPPFSAKQIADLQAQFPEYVMVSNPFDYNTSVWGDRKAQERCFCSALGGDHSAAFLIYDHPSVDAKEVDEWVDTIDAFIAAHQATAMPAFVVSTISELLPTDIRNRLLEHGVVPLQGLEDGMYGYAAAARYYAFRRECLASMSIPRRADLVVDEPTSLEIIDEWHSKQQLAAAGLRVPTGSTCTVTDAADVAERIGFPVVVKALGDAFMHKTEQGAVALNLTNRREVLHAIAQITHSTRKHGHEAAHFLIEKMVTGVIAELIVGVKRDQQFGPALVIGSGGILVELLADSASLLLPTSREEVRTAISRLSVSRLLHGYRGSNSADTEALIDAILTIAAYADDHWDTLQELDVNPLMVLEDGKGVVAADALIVHRPAQ